METQQQKTVTTHRHRRGFLHGAGLAAILLATTAPVYASADAQTPDMAAKPKAARPAKAVKPAPAASKQAADRGEDIVVTATRRASTISHVPLSVSAFSQQTMDQKGARTIADVVRFTPGVSFDPVSNNISIRGISSEAGSGTTGIYIDDTPIQIRNLGFNAENAIPDIFDLDRVEILRGPQGTLFGSGSEGGTVRYITPQPGLEDFSMYGRSEVSASQYGSPSYEAGLAVGGPIITDKLAFRVSATHRTDGGYLDHTDYRTGDITATNTNYDNVNVYRGAVTAVPIDGLQITPSVLYQERLKNDTDAYFEGISNTAKDVFLNQSPEYIHDDDRYYLPSLNVKYDAGPITIISNTSYLHRDNLTGYNGTIYNLSYYNTLGGIAPEYDPLLLPTGINPALPYYISPSRVTNTQRNFTQELRLQSNDSDARVTWVAGAFYQYNRQLSSEQIEDPIANQLFLPVFGDTIENIFGAPLYGKDSYINQTYSTDQQAAFFADATARLFRGIKFEAGVRVAHTQYRFSNFADGSQNGGYTNGAGGTSETPVTPKFTLSDQIDPSDLVYVTWAEGYREGGANSPVPASVCAADFTNFGITKTPNSYSSDNVKSWEIGTKNQLFNNRIEIGASIYTINWNNIQQSVLLPTCGITYTGNLGTAVSRGFDVQVSARPYAGVVIDSSVGFTDAHYTSDTAAGANGADLVVRSGDSIGEPLWKVSFGAQYNVPRRFFTVFGGQPYIRADYQYVGRASGTTPVLDSGTVGYDPGYTNGDATNFVSLRAGLMLDRSINLSIFVDNLLNDAPTLSHLHETGGSLLYYDTTLRPRYIGFTVTVRK